MMHFIKKILQPAIDTANSFNETHLSSWF